MARATRQELREFDQVAARARAGWRTGDPYVVISATEYQMLKAQDLEALVRQVAALHTLVTDRLDSLLPRRRKR